MTITDSYTACAIVEGFDGEEHSAWEELQAWSYLVKTRQAYSLQGWYGRTAAALIQDGLLDESGNITDKGENYRDL